MSKPDNATTGRGYGAQPHGRRCEGYPNNQATPAKPQGWRLTTGRLRSSAAASRDGLQCAHDATSRPEKPVFKTPRAPFFYPAQKNLQSNQALGKVYIV